MELLNLDLDYKNAEFENELNSLLTSNSLNYNVNMFQNSIDWKSQKILTDSYSTVRMDTGQVFGNFKKGYVPYQNSEVVELALAMSKLAKTKIEKIETLDNGAILNVYIKGRNFEIPTSIDQRAIGDIVRENFVISNSHNGKLALSGRIFHEVLSCTNGMTTTKKSRSFSVKHTSNMKNRLKNGVFGLKKLISASDTMFENYSLLNKEGVNGKLVSDSIFSFLDLKKGQDVDTISTRTKNQIDLIKESIETEFDQKGRTRWALYNGFTRFSNHHTGDKETAIISRQFGRLATKVSGVYEFLLKNATEIEYQTIG